MIKTLYTRGCSVVAKGKQGGPCPPNGCVCPPSLVYSKKLFLEHHAMTRRQTMMEKGVIRFKHNSP